MKTVCVYHSIDLDGWMSAAIVKHWWLQNESIKSDAIHTIEFKGYNYGQPIPNLFDYDTIIMCDVSFPREEMIKLNYHAAGAKHLFTWIDHHKSALEENKDLNIHGMKGTNYAACELTWMHFFSGEPMPEIVRLLGRYDCFGHKPQWKPVDGYEGIYEVSSHGKVRSIDRIVVESNTNKSKQLQGKELSPAVSKRGYLVVNLFKDNVGILRNVHDLVAKAFIPNPKNKPTVNHKDSNRLNCYATNLEWNTYEENNNHSIASGDRGYPVSQYDKNNNYITTFDSIIIAEKETGIASQNIGKVCKGERGSAGGFIWKYDTKKSTPQFIPQDEEQKVLEFQYGARQCISNYEEAYNELRCCQTYFPQSGEPTREYQIWEQGATIYKYLCTEAKQTYKNGFEIKFWIDSFPTDEEIRQIPAIGICDICGKEENTQLIRYYFRYENDKCDCHSPYHFDLFDCCSNCKPKAKNKVPKRFICINKERFNPINFGIDYHKDGYDGCACFHYDGVTKLWKFSLYNDNGEIDCSQIAKQYNGGGHKGAAGFVVKNLNDIFK